MKSEREQQILAYLSEHEMLTTEEAVRILKTSPATVRRLFNELAESNTVRRVRGGVKIPVAESRQIIPFFLRGQWFSEEKKRLAGKAVEFMKEDTVAFIHGGSTTSFLGMYLDRGTVIVNSLAISKILCERFPSGGGPKVILTGGVLDLSADIISGSAAERSVLNYHADLTFLSASGLDETGLLDVDDESVGMQSAMIRNSDRAIVIADHSKLGRKAMARSAAWEEIDILITDFRPENHEIVKAARAKGVQVILI